MKQERVLFISKLMVSALLFGCLGPDIAGWAGFGRTWLGIGALRAALLFGAAAPFLRR